MKKFHLFALCAVVLNVACATNNDMVSPEQEILLTGQPGDIVTLRVSIDTDYSQEISSIEFTLWIPERGVEIDTQSCDSCPIDEPCFTPLEPFEAEVQVERVGMSAVTVSMTDGVPFVPSFSTGEVAILNVVISPTASNGIDFEEFRLLEVSALSPEEESLTIGLEDFRLQVYY